MVGIINKVIVLVVVFVLPLLVVLIMRGMDCLGFYDKKMVVIEDFIFKTMTIIMFVISICGILLGVYYILVLINILPNVTMFNCNNIK